MAWLGLDLGTSGLKAILIDEDETATAEASAPLSVSRPRSGWAEQDPADWIAATERALGDLAGRADLSRVRGVGLSGQMHGATLLDAADRPLRPAILWNDVRAHEEAATLDADPRFRAVGGNIVFPGFTAPKLIWCALHEPEVFERIATVLLPKDHIRLWLTGERVSDMSDAAGTSWLDVAARDWSDELLAATGLDRSRMPALVEGSAVSGQLRAEVASRFGLPAGIVVAGGAGDNAAAAIGLGVLEEGSAFVSLGTSGVLFAATDGFRPNAASAVHAFCHAVPGRWHQMGVILAATDALNWLATVVGADPAALLGGLGEVRAPGRTLFLPYLGGERTPHNDPAARGAFLGLEHAADREALARAVLEGVSFAFADSRDALAAAGTRLATALATGGGARSDHWLAMLATALDCEIAAPAQAEHGAAFGAARLAALAAGSGAPEDLAAPRPIRRVFTPDPALRDAFAEGHERYRRAYGALREAGL